MNEEQPVTIMWGNATKSISTHTATLGGTKFIIDPEVSKPLLAVNDITEQGNTVTFGPDAAFIRVKSSNEKILMHQNSQTKLWTIPLETMRNLNQNNNASIYTLEVTSSQKMASISKRVISLHRSMGHASTENMCSAINNGMWLNTGLETKVIRQVMKDYSCLACIMGKSNMNPTPIASDPRTTVPGHTVSTDPVPINITGVNGEKWIYFFKDIATGFWIALTGKLKSEYPEKLTLVIEFFRKKGHPMRVIRSDDEWVCKSTTVSVILLEADVLSQSSVPYQHHQNSAERDIQTLLKSMATMMHDQTFLKANMWPYALDWVVETRNRTPNKNCPTSCPAHIIAGTIVNLHNTYSFCFGDPVAVGTIKEHRHWKFDTKRNLAIYLGQPDDKVNGHLIYFPHDHSIKVRGDVIRIEANDAEIMRFYANKLNLHSNVSPCKSLIDYVDNLKDNNDSLLELFKDTQAMPTVQDREGEPVEKRTLRSATRNHAMPEDIPPLNIAVDQNIYDPIPPADPEIIGDVIPNIDDAIPQPDVMDELIQEDALPAPIVEELNEDIDVDAYDNVQVDVPIVEELDENIGAEHEIDEMEEPAVEQLDEYIDEGLDDDHVIDDEQEVVINAAKVRTDDNPTVTKALRQPDAPQWRVAIKSEVITNLIGSGTLEKVKSVPPNEKITHLTMQMKKKYLPDGEVDKHKARCCFRGDQMEKNYTETYSPTISNLTLAIIQNIAVIDGMHQAVVDTVGAYLQQDYPANLKQLYVKIDRDSAEISGLNPRQIYLVRKYLYGIPDSGRSYYIAYSTLIVKAGYSKSNFDGCLFYKTDSQGTTYICTHVDDTYVCASSRKLIDQFIAVVKTQYEVTVKDSVENYVGVHYEKLSDGSLKKTQPKLLNDLFTQYDIQNKPSVKTPATVPSAFDKELEPYPTTKYLSLLGSLLYVTHSRPDIGFAVSFCATKSKSPTVSDWKDLIRILQYLYQTREKGMIIMKQEPNCDLVMNIYVDASYLLYSDSKSQTGYAFSLNDVGFLYSKSSKQSIVTTSSTHSEVKGLYTAITEFIYIEAVCEEIGRPLTKPAIVHEDNLPAIMLLTKEQSTPKASKHFLKLINYVKERLRDEDIVLQHIATNLNVPDILTKHVFGQDFQFKAQRLLGIEEGDKVELPLPLRREKNAAMSEHDTFDSEEPLSMSIDE